MRPWPLPFARGGPGASRMGWSVPGGGGRHGLRRRGDGGDSPAGVGRHGVAGGAGGRRVDPGAGAGGLVAERTTGRTGSANRPWLGPRLRSDPRRVVDRGDCVQQPDPHWISTASARGLLDNVTWAVVGVVTVAVAARV